MTETRCPMCGKPNPEDAEVCQHCQARLKPLIAPTPPEGEAEEGRRESSEPRTPPQESDDSDWLQALRPSGEELEDDQDLDEGEDDWLEEEDETSQSEPFEVQGSEDDWLSDLRQEGEIEADSSDEDGDQDEEPEWVSPFEEREGDEGLPHWLSDAEDEAQEVETSPGEPPVFEGADFEEPEGGEQPEWLRRIRDRQQKEEIEPTAEGEAEPEELLSQWESDEEVEVPPEEASEEPPFMEDQELPEWISESSQTGEELPSTTEGDDEEELPDWLAQEEQDIPPEPREEIPDWLPEFEGEETQAEVSEGGPEEELPDWLEGVEEAPEEEPPTEARPAWPSGKSIPGAKTEAEPQEPEEVEQPEELPEWVADLEASKPVLDEPQLSAREEEQEEEISFDWLEEGLEEELVDEGEAEESFGEVEEPVAESAAEPVPPFVTGEESLGEGGLPEWLTEAASEDETYEDEEVSEEAEEEEGDIERAELPGWLEAMRPVEAVAPISPLMDKGDEVVESSGPLAGLQGVIPAEMQVARGKKPASYSIKLQVSENQQTHAGVLKGLIESEGEPRPIPSERAISSLFFLRLAIFILLAVVVFWPVLTGSRTSPLPAFSSGVLDANNAINQISSSAPVLFAVDYNPALSGEMEAAAGAVLDHLMVKGSYLALVSTTPTGPAQAERLVKTINTEAGHHYQGLNEYANLGYIPGGQTGLLSFARNPRRTLPFDLSGEQVWQASPLQNVTSLSDFDLAVVATENPDTARAWIEQVQPQLGQVPLIMVVSAQAEPMVRPYYEGRPQQVQGFLSGLSGGASYDALMNRDLLARKYWDAFSLGILAAAGLILIGGGVSLVTALISGEETKGGQG